MAASKIPTARPPATTGMGLFEVTIEGVTPLLQHRFTENEEQPAAVRRVHRSQSSPRDEAEQHAYRDKDRVLFFPAAAIARLIREAGSGHKERGSRRSVKYVVPAAVLIPEEIIRLRNGDGRSPATEFEVDSRPVVIPATKGRIMRHRPRLNTWSAAFTLEIDTSIIQAEFVHQLLTEGGQRLGIGDFRPEKGGPYGRFRVTHWQVKG